MSSFAHLLSPGRIGTLEIRNRLMQTAMGTNLAEPGGFFGDELIAYYEARAAGGVGLIITEAVAVGWPQGAALFNQVAVSDDKYIPGLTRLAQAVQQHGAKIALQLHFGGMNAARDMIDGRDVWVPSLPLPPKGTGFQGALFPEEKALTQAAKITSPPKFREIGPEDIAQLVEWFAAGALRAKQAGFDAVEIHGGHGYIIAGFLSASSNRRTDEYGGPKENRARVLREITADLCWLSAQPMDRARTYLIRHTTREVRAKLVAIDHRLDVNTQERLPAERLAMNDIARVRFRLAHPVFADAYATNRSTGAFVVIDEGSNGTVGAGMIVDDDRAAAGV